jgi:LmbE family N-acetylglucosaminyl deacetylase
VTPGSPAPKRALAIGSHPDDVEFGCGATLAKWAAGGCVVSHLICTDGSKGSWDPDEDKAALVAVRQEEQRAAAAALGATGACVFLDAVDGELENDVARRRQLVRWIRVLRPDIVLGHDPWKRYRLHPDHRAAGFLTVDAVVAARDPHFFADLGVAHHRPSELWLFEADEPDHVENVDGFVDAKIDALLAHRSQWRSTHDIVDEAAVPLFRTRVNAEITTAGGEAFRRIVTL